MSMDTTYFQNLQFSTVFEGRPTNERIREMGSHMGFKTQKDLEKYVELVNKSWDEFPDLYEFNFHLMQDARECPEVLSIDEGNQLYLDKYEGEPDATADEIHKVVCRWGNDYTSARAWAEFQWIWRSHANLFDNFNFANIER